MYSRTFIAGWGDMDFNAHMRNTAYLDRAADVRMLFFAGNGFPMSEFMRLRLGPVVMRDEIEYFKEVSLLQEIRVELAIAGLAADGSRFRMCNPIYRGDGRLAARVQSSGAWLNLDERKLTTPPDALLSALRSLPRTDDYAELAANTKV
jgi:acyl-CoA thioester hydrolase